MIKTPQGFYQFQIFRKFPKVIHAISTKQFGNMKIISKKIESPRLFLAEAQKAKRNLENFAEKLSIKSKNFIAPMQIHRGRIKQIEFASEPQESDFPFVVGPADGLVTNQKEVFLFVVVADCFPILAYEPKNEIIGIAHAGWSGITAGVAKNLILKMKSLGAAPENVVIGLGPGICGKCYEVQNDVASKFRFVKKIDGKLFLDLEKEILAQLKNSGIKKENIETARICVFENRNFFSYRWEKTDSRFAAVIGLGQ